MDCRESYLVLVVQAFVLTMFHLLPLPIPSLNEHVPGGSILEKGRLKSLEQMVLEVDKVMIFLGKGDSQASYSVLGCCLVWV